MASPEAENERTVRGLFEAALTDVVADVEEQYPAATVSTSVPDSLFVLSDDRLALATRTRHQPRPVDRRHDRVHPRRRHHDTYVPRW